MKFSLETGVSTLLTLTYDGCLLALLTAKMAYGAENALSCQYEGPIFSSLNTDKKKVQLVHDVYIIIRHAHNSTVV